MEYIKEDLETMLRNHLKNESKKTELQLKHEEYRVKLNHAGTVYEDTDEEVIESMQLAGQAYDSVHSNTNKVSDTTGNTAMNYKKEIRHINKFDREYLKNKIEECEREEAYLDKQIVRVKNLLSILSEKQKFVIDEFYILHGNVEWKKVQDRYSDEFPKELTIKQLQNIRDVAIKDMLEVLNYKVR